MLPDPLLAEMKRATYIAWVATGIIGLAAGFALRLVFGAMARLTRMRVVSAVTAALLGVSILVGLQALRYRIEEAPFEPPVWIHPGWISHYLPAAAVFLGVMLAAGVTRHVAAR